ncbi:MAG: hypothetical protein K5662_03045 [Lachnospiraceae bacterium]|nr:hypothetical protein [Lachnospiraceae bacterium]
MNTTQTKLPGVYATTRKNNSIIYRSSFTFKGKHISLGSFDSPLTAGKAYESACRLSQDMSIGTDDYSEDEPLPFEKWVVIINYRDNDLYIATPIYIRKRYLSYYLDPQTELKFSIDDLFYYSSHKIMRRGSHLFVADYGMQVSIKTRYGIKPNAVEGRDYYHKNGDNTDYRYENIEILNSYNGVEPILHKNRHMYRTRIHINGYMTVGYYDTPIQAAIAYNKAIDILRGNGIERNYRINYIEEISARTYADIYHDISVSKKIWNYIAE